MQLSAKPLEGLAQVLTTPIPLLTDVSEGLDNGPIYFADLIPDHTLASEVVSFANAVIAINGLSIPSGGGEINLGSFTVVDPRQGGAGTTPAIEEDDAATDVDQEIDSTDPAAGDFLQSSANLGDASGFDFPILDDPTNAFDLLLGMNATLFTYTMPTVTLSLGGQETIQTGAPGLEVEIDSQVDISFSASIWSAPTEVTWSMVRTSIPEITRSTRRDHSSARFRSISTSTMGLETPTPTTA